MKFISKARRPIGKWRRQTGQTLIIVVIAVAVFLLAVVGLAVDFSHLWLHRQMAQGAADAACQAGAMDLLDKAADASVNPGFVIGTPLTSCNGLTTSTPPAVPCWYAAKNGYDSSGGATLPANTESNNVAVTFPPSITGITAPPSSLAGAYPYMRVDVTDRVKVFFSALLTGSKTQDVVATAKCGLVLSTSPIPIVVLHPTMKDAFNISGGPAVKVYGGPSQSVQVNSDWSTGGNVAADVGGTSTLDLSRGGPNHTGSDFGVFGSPATETACTTPTSTNCWLPGTTGHWLHASPMSDPFAQIPAPTTVPPAGTVQSPIYRGTTDSTTNDANCPVNPLDTTHYCTRYFPGSYSGQIDISGQNALFVPGLYYITGTGPNDGLKLGSNSMVRPSALAGDGNGGTTFYLTGTASVNVGSTSGCQSVDASGNCTNGGWTQTAYPPLPFDPNAGPTAVQCTGGPAPDPPFDGLAGDNPLLLIGNVFLGPCRGTYGIGDVSRGMIFFHERSTAATANMNGGGSILVAGSIYFHQLSSYGSGMNLTGQAGSDTRVLGNIIVDQLNLNGGGSINMVLNPNSVFKILKVQLLQ